MLGDGFLDGVIFVDLGIDGCWRQTGQRPRLENFALILAMHFPNPGPGTMDSKLMFFQVRLRKIGWIDPVEMVRVLRDRTEDESSAV